MIFSIINGSIIVFLKSITRLVFTHYVCRMILRIVNDNISFLQFTEKHS